MSRGPPAAGPTDSASGDRSWGTIPKWSAVRSPPSETISARSTAFASSRISPGQRWDRRRARASRLSPGLSPANPCTQLAHEVICQEQDIVAAFAQGREVDTENVEAVEEILPERARRHGLRQIPVGGDEQPDVRPESHDSPHALELVLLEYP